MVMTMVTVVTMTAVMVAMSRDHGGVPFCALTEITGGWGAACGDD